MGNHILAAAALVATAATPAAQPPTAPSPAPASAPVQQQFDAASEAYQAGRFEEALGVLESLERRLAAGRDRRSLAIVRVRKGQALDRLNRLPEAETILRAALPLLPAADASLNEDRFLGYVVLARAAEVRLDYREAAGLYRTAAAIGVEPAVKLAIMRGLIQSQMFHDAPAALAAADEALRMAAAAAPEERELAGQFRALRGRVLLNLGRLPEAREELERATRRLGGLGNRVNLRDLVARSDLSIAALLAGDTEGARRYLALTGAGLMREAALPSEGRVRPPLCGEGLSESDVGVVEIAIRDDGTVGAATPVYASIQGEAAVRFARAALAWSWYPETVRRIEPVFRAAVRVEVRCTTSTNFAEGPPAREVEEVGRWSAERGVPIEVEPARSVALPQMRADLAAALSRHGASSPHLLQPLLRIAVRDGVPARERVELLGRALPIAQSARAPSPYIARVASWLAEARSAAADGSMPNYIALLREPGLAADRHVAAWLHLAQANALYREGRHDEAAATLTRAEALLPLGADDALRSWLVEQRVAVEMARGDAAAAAASWRTLPSGAATCTIGPVRQRASSGSTDFPDDAMAWGFTGWATVEAKVGPDGMPSSPRTILAYPAFVFGGATERMVSRFRYTPAFAPDGRSCATIRQTVRFQLPG